jgi:hypothetical protein
MKKIFNRSVLISAVCLFSVFLTGCFEDEVTFKGKVLIGDIALVLLPDGSVYETFQIRGPVKGAYVREAGHSETAVTDTSGNYEFSFKVPRVIGLSKPKSYRLHCWASGSTARVDTSANPIVIATGAGDEPITNYAEAKPGDTIQVRDFVLLKHTVNEYQDPTGTSPAPAKK